MKKLIALVLVLTLVASIGTFAWAEGTTKTADTAETVTELNWSEVKADVKKSGIKGDFVSFEEVAVKMWLPDVLKAQELTEEDREMGFIGYYEAEDKDRYAVVAVVYTDMGGMELEEYAEALEDVDGVSDIEMLLVNDIPCVCYEIEEQDSISVTFMTEAGYALEITCAPISDELAMTVAAYIVSSIMPAE